MIKNKFRKIFPLHVVIAFFMTMNNSFADEFNAQVGLPQFDSGEHQAIGDTLTLHDINGGVHSAADFPLPSANGLKMTFGSIISLAGDFFGVPNKPISQGKNQKDIEMRFKDAYDTLCVSSYAITPATELLKLVAWTRQQIDNGMKAGIPPHQVYAEIEPQVNKEILKYDVENSHPLYVPLLLSNFDHYTPQNATVFATGYRLALQTAEEAHQDLVQNHNAQAAEANLEKAYTLLGFASHYITDSYAAGHMRSPRLALHNEFGLTGDMLIIYQHNEENTLGLNVVDSQGNRWKAYGDAWYFEDVNKTHREHITQYMQEIVDSVYNVAIGKPPIVDPKNISPILVTPTADNLNPMFKVVNNKVYRRQNLKDPNDSHYLVNWNPLWTLAALMWEKSHTKGAMQMSVELQQELTGVKIHSASAPPPT